MTERDGAEVAELELLERILATENAAEFREFVRERLALGPDEAVLSIGCGPGFELDTFASDLGDDGRILGTDVNGAVLAAARDRCTDVPQITVARGDATDLPVADGSFDVAVAKQVFQFVPDLDAALSELVRVLRPGGRAVVVAGDVDGRILHTTDPDRNRRVQDAYRAVRPHPHLGSRLRSTLPAAGLEVERVEPRARVHTDIDDQVERGIEVNRAIAAEVGEVAESDLEAWESDLRDLDEAGEFLSCGTTFLYVARKPV